MWTAVLALAVIQGLTEFLPVSSSGHLTIGQYFLGFGEPDVLLDVWLHVGTLLATLLAYRKDILQILKGLIQREDDAWRYTGLLMLGCVPTAVIGLGFKDQLEAAFAAPWITGVDLVATGVLLLIGATIGAQRSESKLAVVWWSALLIGTAQGIAILPGISRSGSTVVVAMLAGIARTEAARFSFLLSVPAIAGATLLQTNDYMEGAVHSAASLPQLATGTLAAFIVGYVSLLAFLRLLRTANLKPFAAYCMLMGGTFAGYVLLG